VSSHLAIIQIFIQQPFKFLLLNYYERLSELANKKSIGAEEGARCH